MAMTEVAQATVTIIPNMKGAQQTIAKDLGADTAPAGESAGKLFGSKMVGTIKKVAAVAAIGKFIGDSINEGAKLQQSLGGIETLFKDNADVVKGYASQAYKTAGMSANEYMENVTSFSAALIKSMDGDTAAAAELANTAMIDMSDNANKMGTDMASIQNAYQGFAKGNYAMLDNLKLGYGGTKEEMERLLADASKLSGQEYDISSLDDVYEAIHVIQTDLGITGTTAKEASETFAGSFDSMKAAATDLMGNLALGNDIGPQITALGDSIQTFVVGNLLPMVGNVVKQIPTIIGALPGFLAEAIPEAIPVIADMVAGLAQGVVDNIPVFVQGVGQLLVAAWNAIMDIDWSGAGQIVVDLLEAAWNGLVDIATGIWDTIYGVFTGEIEFPDLSEAARTVWNALTGVASSIWGAVKAWFTKTFTWPNISDAAQTVWNGLVGVASSIWSSVKAWFQKTFTFPSLTEAAKGVWNGLTTAASEVWNAIKGWFTKTFNFPSLTELAKGVWNGLASAAQSVWTAIKTWFQKTFSFPSLDELASAAWDTLTGIASGIWDGIKGVFGATDISFADVSEAASTAWDAITTAATTVWDGIKDIFGSFEITWPDFGALAQGALDSLKDAAKGVWNWVKGLFSGKEDDEAVKEVQGSTTEMAAALADAKLKISSIDATSLVEANERMKNMVLGWMGLFSGMKNWMVLPTPKTSNLESTSQVIVSWVDVYKKKMNFSWRLPTLHGTLPVISVNMKQASSSDGKTKVNYPELSVSSFKWFAEGGIFSDPTIIGIGDSNGPEAAVPLDMMWRQMNREFDEHLGNGATVTNYITVQGAEDPAMYAETLARELKQQMRMRVS